MEQTPNSPENIDPALTKAIRDLAASQSGAPDELTRRRHLAAMRKARAGARRRLVAVSVAAAVVALAFGANLVSNSSDHTTSNEAAAPATLAPLKKVTKLSAVPFARTENYTILNVSSARAKAVAKELATTMGTDASVIGATKKSTTFVVPQSVAQSLTDTSGITATPDSPMKATADQLNPPSWGLDRLDGSTLDNKYSYISEGASEYVYVIDTGVYAANTDFGGRVISGYDAVNDGNGTTDCNGHGTHVAGTVAGTNYGVAKSAQVVAVRVLDCNGAGYSSSVVAGINWVIASHPGGTGVINLSLGGPANTAVDDAVKAATDAGLIVVVAAGNSSADACNYSPARAPSALTIGAIDRNNAQASYSNSGSCVDMWAPGSQITSDAIGASATATMSGTSMASPHVAGLAARMMQARPGITAAQVSDLLTASSLSTNPNSIPEVMFAETPDFAAPTTSSIPATTTTLVSTTLPSGPTTLVPPVSTTVAPSPSSTLPKRGDDDKKPTASPMPKEFDLEYGDDKNVGQLIGSWKDDNTPEQYRMDCLSPVAGNTPPIPSRVFLARTMVTSNKAGEHTAVIPMALSPQSRCTLSAVIGAVVSNPSNVAVVPVRPVVPTTSTTIPRTTTTTIRPPVPMPSTTVPRSTTTTIRPPVPTMPPVPTLPPMPTTTTTIRSTTTTVAPSTTVAPANRNTATTTTIKRP